MPRIEIFTKAFCPYCARALALLERKGVGIEEFDAPDGSPARREAIERSGGRLTVPQIFIGGVAVGGYDDLVALDRAGRLDPMIAA